MILLESSTTIQTKNQSTILFFVYIYTLYFSFSADAIALKIDVGIL
jgi:hypothetical protein